ncbi:hypothetical protein D6817_02280 [Candidatus Pacearchaeota archaeon]|nr:MAG: hypothetical protein D6817_02280 [Candidatus Pacearchaeota archaeon]
MLKKRAYEFGFASLFAIIVGAFIILLAIIVAVKLTNQSKSTTNTLQGYQLGILTTPIETNLEESKIATIEVPRPTSLFNICTPPDQAYSNLYFGKQELNARVKIDIGQESRESSGVSSTFLNKYFFSSQRLDANQIYYVLSKRVEMPFKVANVLIMWSDIDNYCVSDPANLPSYLKSEMADIGLDSFGFDFNGCDNAGETTKRVCFDCGAGISDDCDVVVCLSNQWVKKLDANDRERTIYYPLSTNPDDKFVFLYGAIFSDPDVYVCQIKRLAARAKELAQLYRLKSNELEFKGCRSQPLKNALPAYISFTDRIITADPLTSSLIEQWTDEATRLENENAATCKIF